MGFLTAVFNAIRSLDALLDRGDLTPEEYARRRAMIMQNIEDAEADLIDITPVEEDAPDPAPTAPQPVHAGSAAVAKETGKSGSTALGLGLVVVLGVMGLCIALTLLFLPNMNLALTLGVTILAALCVALLHAPDD